MAYGNLQVKESALQYSRKLQASAKSAPSRTAPILQERSASADGTTDDVVKTSKEWIDRLVASSQPPSDEQLRYSDGLQGY